MRITALAGGVGGARFLRGLLHHARQTYPLVADPDRPDPLELTVIGNTGDDITLFGLRVCPDIDTLLYTLGGGIHEGQGWGRADESHHLAEELAALGAEPQWFTLGDKDFGTHVYRSQLLGQGMPLSGVVERLSARWGLGELGVRLLPMTDTPVETHVVVEQDGQQRAIHFQEWWVRYRAQLPTHSFAFVGAEKANATTEATDAIADADVVLIAPSNPVVSVGAILAVPGIRSALRSTGAPVVGYSPIIYGKPLRGMADECLSVIGVDSTAEAVGRYHGARAGTGILDGWLVHEGDHADIDGITVKAIPLLMTDPKATAEMVSAGLELAGVAV
jgi:LPPG:FO 2-phospho-L-lactate transferase